MPVRIVGVHGVWNHKPDASAAVAAAHIGETWTVAVLAAHPALRNHVELTAAYYAPVVNGLVAQGGDDIDYLPSDAKALIRSWANEVRRPLSDAVAQGYLTMPLRRVLDDIARQRGLGTLTRAQFRLFVATCFREVAAYFRESDPANRAAAQAVVMDCVASTAANVVIAHSLGSVVAYEALWNSPDVQVDLLLTLGSPLRLPTVFDRLLPGQDRAVGRRPPGVRRWVNLADPGDLIAVPRPLSAQFDVDEDHEESISLVDFHTVDRYLRNRRVGEALATLLGV